MQTNFPIAFFCIFLHFLLFMLFKTVILCFLVSLCFSKLYKLLLVKSQKKHEYFFAFFCIFYYSLLLITPKIFLGPFKKQKKIMVTTIFLPKKSPLHFSHTRFFCDFLEKKFGIFIFGHGFFLIFSKNFLKKRKKNEKNQTDLYKITSR